MTQDQINHLRALPVAAGQLFIGGAMRPALDGATMDVTSPIDGRVFTQIAAGSARDVDAAVQAARVAFDGGKWSRAAPAERKKVMLRIADLIEKAIAHNRVPFALDGRSGVDRRQAGELRRDTRRLAAA